MRSWVDALEGVIKGWKVKGDNSPGDRICEAIVQGVNHRSDTTLLCKDIAPRVQTVGILKNGTFAQPTTCDDAEIQILFSCIGCLRA